MLTALAFFAFFAFFPLAARFGAETRPEWRDNEVPAGLLRRGL